MSVLSFMSHLNGRVDRQLRESAAALELAASIHVADVRLGRCRDCRFDQLTPAERQEKVDRAAVAIRLADPLVIAAAEEHAARAVYARHSRILANHVAKFIAREAIGVALDHFRGFIRGRS